jgi:hypothetical protein
MKQKYTFGGVSAYNGEYKVRVGQGKYEDRIKAMVAKGHTDICLVNFDTKMSKAEICMKLLDMDTFKKFYDIITMTYHKKMADTGKEQTKVMKLQNLSAIKNSMETVKEEEQFSKYIV